MVGWDEKTRGNGDLTVILPTDVGLQPSNHTMLVTNDSGNLLSHFNPPIQPLQITNMIDHHLTGEDLSPCFLLVFSPYNSKLPKNSRYLGVSKNSDTPEWMVKIMETPIRN